MKLVLSGDILCSDKELIFGGQLLMYVVKSKFSTFDPRGTPNFIVPQFEKKFGVSFDDFISTFYLQSLR
jgi:hypothetical protein